jgi:predicted nucleotidyltransferase
MAIPAETIASYREGLRRRLSRPLTETEQTELDKARAEAERLAHELVEKHGARQVLLFGSVARRRPLRPDSDIDLAVSGMSSEVYYEIVGDLFTDSGREVDLVRLERVRSSVKRVIFLEGITLVDLEAVDS